MTKVRKAFIQHHSLYWVGVKFDTDIKNFVWGDGTSAPNRDADFEAVVNRTEQLSQGFNKRCMFIDSDGSKLQAAQCDTHYMYICQSGDHEDAGVLSSSLLGTTSLLSSQSTSLPVLLPSLSLSPIVSLPPMSSVVSSLSSASALVPSLATRTTLSPKLPPTLATKLIPTATVETQNSNSVEAEISLEEKLINEFAHEMDVLNVSESSSLKRAVNISSSLLKDIHKVQAGEIRTNMLVHLDKLEKVAFNYAKLHVRSEMNSSAREISFVSEELALAVLRIPALYNKSVFFPSRMNASVSSGKFWKQEDDFIKLPHSLFTTQERFAVCMLHNDARRLIPKKANILIKKQNTTLVSRIISCTLTPKVHDVFSNPVAIKFQSKKEHVEAIPHCVFWNFSISSRFHGAWSQDGCTLAEDQKDAIMCRCNHLTNFAVLMEVGETKISASDKNALGMVTYIGTSLSLFGEIITMLVYIFVCNVKSIQSHIRLNMVFCLAIAQLTFLTGISATGQRLLCIAVAITINYFYLVAFAWMVMEGVMLYLKVVKVFNVTTNKKYFYGFAWGFPTFLVTIAVALNTLIHGNMDDSIRNDVCWFSFSSGFVWAFVGPVLVACLVNLAILSRILLEMIKMKGMPGNIETNMVRQSLKACAVLSPLLGFAWMFGILTVTRAGLVFQYMFAILNSLQGFFIFVFHIVLSKETRTALETIKRRWETTRSASMAKEESSLAKEKLNQRKDRTNLVSRVSLERGRKRPWERGWDRTTRSTNKVSPSTPDNFNLPPVILNK
ncbi:adhesion G-protein coupled receptor D1-like isoform X1 [Acropora palmata]|uniref:adhesion G-protein coupled receptor D1-like isoform X1 n=2 Tax=Acropora palmata TaxID=6131 RepID=UPI003DA0761F